MPQLLVNEGLPLARTTIPPGQVRHLNPAEDRGLHFDAQLDRDDPDGQTLMRMIGAGGYVRASHRPACGRPMRGSTLPGYDNSSTISCNDGLVPSVNDTDTLSLPFGGLPLSPVG